MNQILIWLRKATHRRGFIQTAVFFAAAVTFLSVNVRFNFESNGISQFVYVLSSPPIDQRAQRLRHAHIYGKLNYSKQQWSSMLRLGVSDRISVFCDDIGRSNISLVPDCYDSMIPELWIGKNRTYQMRLVMGMPTLTRPVKQYVRSTLKKILRDLPPVDRNSTLILVLLADQDRATLEKLLFYLFDNFRSEIETGLMEIIIPGRHFYRTLDRPPCGVVNRMTFPPEQSTNPPCRSKYLRWRDKQNFDYAYLMTYGSQLGQYYLQMEDDMMCDPDMFPAVFAAISNYTQNPWVFAEVTGRGFRGKMFRANDTFYLAQFIMRHYDEMPCDWLYPIFVQNQPNPCEVEPEKYPLVTDCRPDSRKLILRSRDICVHRGRFSSLKDKVVPIHLEIL